MFRAPKRSLLRSLFERKIHSQNLTGTLSHGADSRNILVRYLSHEPLSSSHRSYVERFPPLYHPLPELKLPSCLPDNVEHYPTKITTLRNGMKIASENSMGHGACVGLFVDCGSIYEKEGFTHLLERLSFKSTKNRSHLHIVQEIEASGGNVGASASREQMAYSYDTLKMHLPQAIEMLVDCVRNPLFLDSEVQEQVDKVKEEVAMVTKDPQQYLTESLHLVGYTGALGNPLVAPESTLNKIDGSAISKFYYDNYTADRMVLAAYSIDHEELLALAQPLLHDLPRGPPLDVPKSSYVGGDCRCQEDMESTHVALAFEVPGGWRQDKDATILTVLQTLMGGGGSFSTGGPGKGMHSRLYRRVLNKHQEVQSFSAFSSIFDETGLFGIFSTTPSDFAAKAVEIASNELLMIATPGQVSEIEFHRAKNATKSAVLMNLESRMINAEDIGRQILTYGHRKPVDHFLTCLDELTRDDLTSMAQKLLSSPLTMASLGDVRQVPSYDSVSQFFRMH